jgi:DNA-binding response OmpR family regulator
MKRLLIVDDEEDMVWSLQKNLRNENLDVDVLTARSGEEALEVLGTTPVDLIISDIRMPGMSGLDLLLSVKKNYPQTGVIIMTAYPTPEFRKDATYRGCLHFIEKPFDIRKMREIVAQAISDDKGFKGTVTGVELTDIIQINCLSKTRAALRVKTAEREGIIYFKDGKITHALCEELEGEEAFYEILAFEGGTLEGIRNAESPEETIARGYEGLLMEGMRRVDERRRESGKDGEGIEQKPVTTTKENTMSDVKALLNEFTLV